MSHDWKEISLDQWESMTAPKASGLGASGIKRNQIPDLRMFKKRFKHEGWLSNRQFRTRSGAERLISKLEKEGNRPNVIYSVFEFPKTSWDSKKFAVLAMPNKGET